jgi:DNA-binding NtrC family response regulator
LKRQSQKDFEALSLHRKNVLVGESPQMITLRRNIEKVRAGSGNVVITGDTGTGKELVARQLRRKFPDGSLEPFLAVDSATIQSTMAESTLFGHEKGAFTGAEKAAKGIFEEANGGIVYFDEIGNMPLEIQAKLLRVLQEKEILRIGSSKVLKLDFRVVCATNRNLEEMVTKGQFKDDLLQRLNVIPLHLSPLRERREDIKSLVEHFVARQHTAFGALEFTDNSIRILKAYSWPGNVRELGNLISYLATMIEGKEVDVADLPPKFRDVERLIESQAAQNATSNSANKGIADTSGKSAFYDRVSAFEEALLKAEYLKHEGNVSQLALTLRMDRSHLYSKLKEYGIHSTRRGSSP